MNLPQHDANESDDSPVLGERAPEAMPQSSYPRDDYDPDAAIALLRQFRDKPSEDPEADWSKFRESARAIDEDRIPGRKWFEKSLTE